MSSGRVTRQFALLAGGVALVGMATLSACGSKQSPESPPTTPASHSQSPQPSPTEKASSNGPNSFTPVVPAAPPGPVCQKVAGNNCLR